MSWERFPTRFVRVRQFDEAHSRRDQAADFLGLAGMMPEPLRTRTILVLHEYDNVWITTVWQRVVQEGSYRLSPVATVFRSR